MMRSLGIMIAFGASLAMPSLAEEPKPAAPRPSEQAAEEQLLKVARGLYQDLRITTLENGLQVCLLPVKDAPTVSTMMAYRVGSADELKDQTGLSHYLEHLLFKGTDKLFPGDIDRLTQRNGGMNNAYTSEDMTVYHFDFAADRWKQAIEIEADRMRNTRIDAKHEFEQEKGAVIAELKGGEDQPWDLEYKAILPLLFAKDAPYSHPVIGEEKHVRAATAEIIQRHYDKWYHPNNATLVIAGGFDPDEALALVKKHFGPIPQEKLPARLPNPAHTPRTKQVRKEFVSKFDTARAMIGFNTVKVGDPDDYVLDVISNILSDGRTSRLVQQLVQKERLANEVTASNYSGRYPGWFSVQVDLLKGKDRTLAEKIVFEELKRLATEPISDEELKRVRRRTLASFLFTREDIHASADYLARCAAYGDVHYATTYLERILKITPAEIQKTAAKLLNPEQAVVVWSLEGDAGDGQQARSGNPRSRLPGKVLRRAPQTAAPVGTTASGPSLKAARRTVLDHGLTLVTLERRRLPIVSARVLIKGVRFEETAKQAGIAALVTKLLIEGTPEHTGNEIATLLENTGSSLSFEMDTDGILGNLQTLTPDLNQGLELMLSSLQRPTMPKDALERNREQLLSTIADVETQPQNRALGLFNAAVYGEHPWGRSAFGKADIVSKLTRKQCREFHKQAIVPNRAIMVVVGDFDTDELIKTIQNGTKNWKPSQNQIAKRPAPPVAGKPGEIIVTDPTASQTHVYIGHIGITRNNPDYYKLLVMDNVLGTGPGFTDRLSAQLRDRQGLAYTVTAQIAWYAANEPGVFLGYIGTFPDKYTWVREGFLKEIQKIRDEPARDAEVDSAKKYLLGKLPFNLTTSSSTGELLLATELFGLGFNYLEEYREQVSRVTVADVQAVARKYLDPKRITIVAVGPIDKDGKALEENRDR